MREWFDSILDFITAESLTDDEYDTMTSTMPIYDQQSYDDLSRVLAAREAVSTLQARLVNYYTAKGVTVVAASTGKSNILVGAVLE